MTSCGCRVVNVYAERTSGYQASPGVKSRRIEYCPLHLAAEEMLAALKELLGYEIEPERFAVRNQARALIARAEGRSQ